MELRLLKAECPIPGRKCTHAGSPRLHGSDDLLPRCLHRAEFQQHLLPPFPHLSPVLGRELTFIDFSLPRDQARLGEEPHTAVCDSGIRAYFTLAYPLTALADQSFRTDTSWSLTYSGLFDSWMWEIPCLTGLGLSQQVEDIDGCQSVRRLLHTHEGLSSASSSHMRNQAWWNMPALLHQKAERGGSRGLAG